MLNKISIAVAALVVLLTVCVLFFSSGEQMTEEESPVLSSEQLEGNAYVRAYSPVLGATDGPVTIVEFFDPSCEACRAFYPFVKKVLASFPGQVRLVLRYATFHKGSEEIVRLLEASRLQGVYEPVLEMLLQTQAEWAIHGNPKLEKAWEFAASAGLNVEAAKKVMFSDEINQLLIQERNDIKTLKVAQTPTFYVNEKALPSFGPQELYDLVNAEVEASKSLVN
jgi:protein-disulfide isomerase